MQGSTGQGNQNGQKQGGLSWTQPPSSGGGMKPVSQTPATPLQNKNAQPAASTATTTTNNKNASLSSLPKKADAKSGTGGGKLASIFLAGVVVGLIVGWGWFSLGKNSGTVATTDTPATSSSSETTGSTNTNTTGTASTGGQTVSSGTTGGALSVPAQAAGLKIAVSNISVSVPTWIVIMDNVNGKPGNALGAQMFFPGQTSGTIELLRATVSGQSYFVGEYVDNGDHTFSKQKDTQVNTVAGSQMLVSFKVQ